MGPESACHLSVSWARPIQIQSMPSQFWKFHFLLSYCPRIGPPSGPLPRPHPQEVGTLLLKSAQFALIFSVPLSYAVVTTLPAGQSRKRASISGRDMRFCPFQKNSDRLWGSPRPTFNKFQVHFPPWQRGWRVKLTNHMSIAEVKYEWNYTSTPLSLPGSAGTPLPFDLVVSGYIQE